VAQAPTGGGSNNGPTGQISRSLTYLVSDTASVDANTDASAQAFCKNGDVLLTGGYSIGGFESASQLSDTVLYSNTPLRIQNATASHEGWEAGLGNLGTGERTVTANAVCLDVTP
jgi:hypothetical protein